MGLFREHPKAQPEGGFRRSPGSNLRPLVYKASDLTTAPRRLLVSLIFFFFPGRDQYYRRLFLWVFCCPGSTRRLNREIVFCSCFRRSPGSNLRPLVYKASGLTTAPWRLLHPFFFFFFFFFFLGETSTIGDCF